MTAEQVAQVPFFLDWKFWSVVASIVAIILSQLPPVHIMIRRAKLDIEAYSRMALSQKVGNPFAQMHLIINNAGGRDVRIKGIELHFRRDSADRFILPAQGYLQSPNDTDAVLLTSFRLKPNQEWGHIVNFFLMPSREEEKEYRQLEANLRQDILEKRSVLEDKNAPDVAADEKSIQPLIKLFNDKFRWKHGEYELTVKVRTEPAKTSLDKEYRITLFESDSKELWDYCLDYQYGYGLSLPLRRQSVFVPLTEA